MLSHLLLNALTEIIAYLYREADENTEMNTFKYLLHDELCVYHCCRLLLVNEAHFSLFCQFETLQEAAPEKHIIAGQKAAFTFLTTRGSWTLAFSSSRSGKLWVPWVPEQLQDLFCAAEHSKVQCTPIVICIQLFKKSSFVLT